MSKNIDSKSFFKSRQYVEYTYDTRVRPYGKYPSLLAKWLLDNVYIKPGKIADFGCGRGDYLDAFNDLGFDPTGFDISSSICNIKNHKVEQVDFISDDAPFAGELFSYIFSKSVIEHMRNPVTYLKNIYKSLEPGGVAVIMTPSWEHTHWGPFYIDHTHISPFTEPSLVSALKMAGFKKLSVNCFYQLPFLWKFPFFKPFIIMLSKLPIRYGPYYKVPWDINGKFNKFIRFSKEPMLLAIATKQEKDYHDNC